MQTQPLSDSRTSLRCIKLGNINSAFCIREEKNNSTKDHQAGLLIKKYHILNYFTQLFSPKTRFDREPTQFCGSIPHFEGAKHPTQTHYRSDGWEMHPTQQCLHSETHHLHILSETTCYLPLFPQEDKTALIFIPRWDNPNKHHLPWDTRMKDRYRHGISFGCSHTIRRKKKWILPRHLKNKRAIEQHNKLSRMPLSNRER